MSDLNACWRSLADRGCHIELAGRYVDALDDHWVPEPAIHLPVEFPDGFGPPSDDLPYYELTERRVSRTRLWKDTNGRYLRQEIVRHIHEVKPEVIV